MQIDATVQVLTHLGLLSSSVRSSGAATHGQLFVSQCSDLREGTLYAYQTYDGGLAIIRVQPSPRPSGLEAATRPYETQSRTPLTAGTFRIEIPARGGYTGDLRE